MVGLSSPVFCHIALTWLKRDFLPSPVVVLVASVSRRDSGGLSELESDDELVREAICAGQRNAGLMPNTRQIPTRGNAHVSARDQIRCRRQEPFRHQCWRWGFGNQCV